MISLKFESEYLLLPFLFNVVVGVLLHYHPSVAAYFLRVQYFILYYIILFLNKKIKSSFGEIKCNNTEKILTFLIFKLVSTLSNSML